MSHPPRTLLDDRRLVPVVLLLITAVGAYFRLVRLGDCPLRADSITFWNICRQNLSAGQIFEQWLTLGHTNQYPLANAFAKWLIDLLGLGVTLFSVRLSCALTGIVTVPVAYGLGRTIGGRRVGIVLAALLAVNPYHIQMSREAYFYAAMILGAFLATWAMLEVPRRANSARLFPVHLYVAGGLGFSLLMYAHPSGNMLALVFLVVLAGTLIGCGLRRKHLSLGTLVMLVLCGLLMIPFFTEPWGLQQLISNTSGPQHEFWAKQAQVSQESFLSMFYRVLTNYSWGSSALRLPFSLAVVALSCLVAASEVRRDRRQLLLPAIFISVFVLFVVVQRIQNVTFVTRYMLPIMPLYLAFLAQGLSGVGDLPALRKRLAGRSPERVAAGLTALALLISLPPADLSTRLTGQPTPYFDIVGWCDRNLPKGTLVLVDRWYEPYNELRVHNSTNVIFTYPVPSEPLDAYLQYNWRQQAMNFLARNPGSAYLEIAKTFFDRPEVGPWTWPASYFGQKHTFVNQAGLQLREMGLAARDSFYASDTNRLIVDIYYDTTADVVEKAKGSGLPALVIFQEGWGYWKNAPGWPYLTDPPDFRDFRVLQDRALLDVYNLTDAPVDRVIRLGGVSLGGSKHVRFGGRHQHIFQNGKPEVLEIGPARLQPGLNRIQLEDTLWEESRVPLLVEGVQLAEAPPPVASAPAPQTPAAEATP